jgi:hypothetical protein
MAGNNSNTRVFRCGNCNHKLRFGARRCGYCYKDTSIWNCKSTWYVTVAVLLCSMGVFFF